MTSGTLRLVASPHTLVSSYSGEPVHVVGPDTAGGFEIEFKGRNLGPRYGDIQIHFGPAWQPNKYACMRTGTQTTVAHTTLRCIVPAGSGRGMRFVVALANGQQSAPSMDAFSYPPPRLLERTLRFACVDSEPNTHVTSVTHVPTAGDTQVTTVLSNVCMLPGMEVNATGTMGGDVLQMDAEFLGPAVGDLIVTYSRPFFHTTYVAEIVSAGTSQTSIRVRTAPGVGRFLSFQVNVSGQTGTGTDVYHYPINSSAVIERNATSKSRVVGDSLSRTVAGAQYALHIQAFDNADLPLTGGGSPWSVMAVSDELSIPPSFFDNKDGTYKVTFGFTRRCIHVRVCARVYVCIYARLCRFASLVPLYTRIMGICCTVQTLFDELLC